MKYSNVSLWNRICDVRLDSLWTVTHICWYEWQLRFLRLRQVRNLPDAKGRNLRRRLENHFMMTLLFISCSSVSNDTLSSPITSKTSIADGTTVVDDCRRDQLIESLEILLIIGLDLWYIHFHNPQKKLRTCSLEGLKDTDHVSQDVQSRVQDKGKFSQQHLPQHYGVAAVSRQITLQKGRQLIGCKVLQLYVWDSKWSFIHLVKHVTSYIEAFLRNKSQYFQSNFILNEMVTWAHAYVSKLKLQGTSIDVCKWDCRPELWIHANHLRTETTETDICNW